MTLPKFLLGSALVAGTLVNGLVLPAPARQSLSARRRVDLAPLRVPNLPAAKRQGEGEGPKPVMLRDVVTLDQPTTPIDEEPEPVPTPDQPSFPEPPPTPIDEEPVLLPTPDQPSFPEPPPTPVEEEPVPTPNAPSFPNLPEEDVPPPTTPVDKEPEVEPVPTPNQPSFPDLTCVGKDPEATFTYTTSAGNYDILCGKDYLNADLSSLQTNTFADCLTACDKEAACVTVAYANGACYLKNHLTTTVSNANVWAAKKQNAKESLTCIDKKDDGKTYQASKGQYKITCGKEYAGGDLSSTSTASFEACIEACVGTNGCIDVSYVNGACYMKDTKTSLIEAGHVWTAELVSAESTPKAEQLSCIDGKDNGKIYTAPSGKKYTVECGIDHAGGDFLTVPHETTFQSCMDVCDNTSECVDVSWVWGTCYLKNTLTKGIELSHVWTGRPIEEVKAKEEKAAQPKCPSGSTFALGRMGSQGPTGTISLAGFAESGMEGFTLGAVSSGNVATTSDKFSLHSDGSLSRADNYDFKFAAQLKPHGGMWVARPGNVVAGATPYPSEYVVCTRDDTGPFSTLECIQPTNPNKKVVKCGNRFYMDETLPSGCESFAFVIQDEVCKEPLATLN